MFVGRDVRFTGRDSNSRHLGLLPRLGGGARRRRPDRRRGAGGALHAQEARRRASRATPSSTACARPGSTPSRLDYVGFYDKPLLKFERLLETYLAYAPGGLRVVPQGDAALAQAEAVSAIARCSKGLGGKFTRRFVFAEHHESHAASAFFPSPFEEAAILTLDGVGEWATATLGDGRGNRDRRSRTSCAFRTRSGLLYSAFTYLLRLQGQLRRVQADGPGAVRRAAVRRPAFVEQAGRPEGRRLVPDGHVVLQLLPGPDDDVAEVRRAVRRAAARAGGADHRARDGPRGVDPEGDRRGHAARPRGTCTRRPG